MNSNNGPPRPSPTNKSLINDQTISPPKAMSSNKSRRVRKVHPFSSRFGPKNHFPGLDDAFRSGRNDNSVQEGEKSPNNKSSFSLNGELDLSIGVRAALAEHKRSTNKHGIDGKGSHTPSPSKSFAANTSEVLSTTRDLEWERLINGSVISLSLVEESNNTTCTGFHTNQALLSTSVLSSLRNPDVTNTSLSYVDQSSDFFNSSRVKCLMTPEKNRAKLDEMSRQAYSGKDGNQITNLPFNVRSKNEGINSQSTSGSPNASQSFDVGWMAGLYSAALRFEEDLQQGNEEEEEDHFTLSQLEGDSFFSHRPPNLSVISTKESSVQCDTDEFQQHGGRELFCEDEPNLSLIEGEERYISINQSSLDKGSQEHLTHSYSRDDGNKPGGCLDQFSEIVNSSDVLPHWSNHSSPHKDFITNEEIAVSEILSDSMIECRHPDKSPQSSTNRTNSSRQMPSPTLNHIMVTKQRTNSPAEVSVSNESENHACEERLSPPKGNVKSESPVEPTKRQNRNGSKFDFLELSPIGDKTNTPNVNTQNEIYRYSVESQKSDKVWHSPSRGKCHDELEDFVIHEDYSIPGSPVSNLNTSRFSQILNTHVSFTDFNKVVNSATKAKKGRLAERYSSMERYDSFSPSQYVDPDDSFDSFCETVETSYTDNCNKENRRPSRRFAV